jgi:hypothetical protein
MGKRTGRKEGNGVNMEIVTIPRSTYLQSDVIRDKDFLPYQQADSERQTAVRDIEHVAGFIHDKVVIIDFER